MSIRLYKSYTPGTRNRALSTFTEITKSKPEKVYLERTIEIKDVTIEVLLQFVTVVVVTKEDIV